MELFSTRDLIQKFLPDYGMFKIPYNMKRRKKNDFHPLVITQASIFNISLYLLSYFGGMKEGFNPHTQASGQTCSKASRPLFMTATSAVSSENARIIRHGIVHLLPFTLAEIFDIKFKFSVYWLSLLK